MRACPQCHQRYPPDTAFCFLDGAALEAIRDPLIGATVGGRYLIEEVIGEGGMATVYRARHTLGDRPCAIKVMNQALAADATVRERFRREAKSVQTLAHPNVVEIFEYGETSDTTPYLAMELLDGRTLADMLSHGGLPIGRAVGIMIQLARGIARAHDLGVVHRDLKPENVFVCTRIDGSDLVKVLDFGIARAQGDPRLTSAGELFGTPQYMAPERITAGEAGPSVDLYALGVLFYEIVTGKLPFEASDPTSYLVQHVNERPRPPRLLEPGLPEALEALILQLLEKEPRARPVDARRVEQDLRAIARAVLAPIPPDPENDPASSHAATVPTPLAAGEGPADWASRLPVFEQMLLLCTLRGSARGELDRALSQMKELVARLNESRQAAEEAQRKLQELDDRGREGRQRFGIAVDALGLDASRGRDELRAARIDFDRLAHQSSRAVAAYEATLRDVLGWEGRCGVYEPHPALADAYRTSARAVDAWVEARRIERLARDAMDAKERSSADLDYQIGELRRALASYEQSFDRERGFAQKGLLDLNERAERIESQLLDEAARFCQPLRARAELAPLFRRLEPESPR